MTADLWTELAAVSAARLKVARIMDTWTKQMGYPVVSVTRQGNEVARGRTDILLWILHEEYS